MIRVNLLPLEYRKAEATPLKQFFATVGAAVIAAGAVVAWLYVHLVVLEGARVNLEKVKSDVVDQNTDIQLYEALEKGLNEYKGQYKKIDDVAQNRLVWSRKLDELWDVVVNPKTPGRYEVWLRNLAVKLAPGSKAGGDVQFGGTSAGPQVFRLSDFHEDLKNSDYFRDFLDVTYPYGTREELPGQNREPKEGWTFNFVLQLKPLKDLYAGRAGRAKAALEAGGKTK